MAKKITRYDRKRGFTLIWFGGHGIHIFKGGQEVGLFNVGKFNTEDASREEVIKGMEKVIKAGNIEDYI
jgi:hypothetical protein